MANCFCEHNAQFDHAFDMPSGIRRFFTNRENEMLLFKKARSFSKPWISVVLVMAIAASC